MPRAVLHDGVAGAKVNAGAVIQLQPHLARHDVLEIDGVGGVHAWAAALHVLGKTRQPGPEALVQGSPLLRREFGLPSRCHGKRHEAKTAQRRKVVRVDGRGSAIRKLRHLVGTPEPVERGSGHLGEGIAVDLRVAHEDRLAARVVACRDSPNLHHSTRRPGHPITCPEPEFMLCASPYGRPVRVLGSNTVPYMMIQRGFSPPLAGGWTTAKSSLDSGMIDGSAMM